MTQKPNILGVGRAFTDIIAEIDEGLLQRYGLNKGMGVKISEDTLHAIIEELNDPLYMAGGSVANTMSGLAALDAEVTFIGKTGDDEPGQVFRKVFDDEGVSFPNKPVTSGTSGTCLCLNTPDGERTFAFTLGVCEDLGPEDIPSSLFEKDAFMLFQALMLETPQCYETMRDLYATMPPHIKKIFCLHDTVSMRSLTPDIMLQMDILIGSRPEVAHILGATDFYDLQELAAQQDLMIAMTDGAKGAVLITPAETIEIAAVPPAWIVDTIGAGDHFAAGFVYGLTQNWPLQDCGDLAVRCASLIIEEPGGRPGKEGRAKMRALVQG